MPASERDSWFQYREGIDPSFLNVGTLVLDYANPKDHRPYRHELCSEDAAAETVSESRKDVFLAFGDDYSLGIGGGIIHFAEMQLSKRRNISYLVVGEDATTIELRDPQKFLNEVVLSKPGARYWLSSRLAIVRKLDKLKALAGKRPEIWLLVKILKVKDAQGISVLQATKDVKTSAKVPVPDPTGVAHIAALKAGANLDLGSGVSCRASSIFRDDKIWAAQYQKLNVRYMSVPPDKDLELSQIPLLNVFSIQGSRGDEDIVEVSNTDEYSQQNVAASSEVDRAAVFDDEYWKQFEEELKDLNDSQGDDKVEE